MRYEIHQREKYFPSTCKDDTKILGDFRNRDSEKVTGHETECQTKAK